MDQLVELLSQIQELAGVGIKALKAAAGGGQPGPEGQQAAPEGPPQGPQE